MRDCLPRSAACITVAAQAASSNASPSESRSCLPRTAACTTVAAHSLSTSSSAALTTGFTTLAFSAFAQPAFNLSALAVSAANAEAASCSLRVLPTISAFFAAAFASRSSIEIRSVAGRPISIFIVNSPQNDVSWGSLCLPCFRSCFSFMRSSRRAVMFPATLSFGTDTDVTAGMLQSAGSCKLSFDTPCFSASKMRAGTEPA
mmetsp:Transcript_64194/g.143464  ORF Transcript_64194/g.143464 Transcript_64194/m.143464 type:complete len:203 (-) Transcript_64194:147-755(-)